MFIHFFGGIMQSTFTLTKDELTIDFLNNLKNLFASDVLDITICEHFSKNSQNFQNVGEEIDETAFLLKNPVNRKILLEGIEEIEKGNVHKISIENL